MSSHLTPAELVLHRRQRANDAWQEVARLDAELREAKEHAAQCERDYLAAKEI